MNEHHVKGALDEVAGRVQSAAGALAGDPADDLKGKAREARAGLEGVYGEAVDAVSDARQSLGRTIQANPMISLLMAAGAAFLLGRLMRRD